MANITPIRDIPQQGLSEWEYAVLAAIKENVETIYGQRQGGVGAVFTDKVASAVQAQNLQQMIQVSAVGAGFTITGSDVAGLADYRLLINDVQTLANDVARIVTVLNTLIEAMSKP